MLKILSMCSVYVEVIAFLVARIYGILVWEVSIKPLHASFIQARSHKIFESSYLSDYKTMFFFLSCIHEFFFYYYFLNNKV